MINRKVTHATSVLGDLVAQDDEIGDDEMDNILDAVASIMNPFPIGGMTMMVAGVTISSTGVATVTWSDARNTTAPAAGSAITIPSGVRQPNTFIVVAVVHFAYMPSLGKVLTGEIDLTHSFYLRQRLGTAVVRN